MPFSIPVMSSSGKTLLPKCGNSPRILTLEYSSITLVIAVNISNIIATNKVKTTDYNGYLKDEQTKKVRKHLSINFALDVAAYAMAYGLIIASLTASVDGTKLLYEYYMIPILTVVSLITALRYLLYPKVYCAFRGAETYEVTGFSEVKLDEEKKQKKLAKKNAEESRSLLLSTLEAA